MGFIQTGFSCVSVGTDLIEEKLVKLVPSKPEKQIKFRNPFIHQQDWCDRLLIYQLMVHVSLRMKWRN